MGVASNLLYESIAAVGDSRRKGLGMGESQSPSTAGMKLFIGIPTYGMPRCEFSIDSLGSLLFHLGRRHTEIEKVWVQRDVRTYRQEARQGIVKAAQEAGATHLLMLDDDHSFSGKEFDLLWESMQREEVQIVSGLYMTRGLPCAPCIFKLTSQGTAPIFYYPENELLSVDVVGFGFVLFDMSLFTRINPPWFNLGMGFGEDAAFCARLLQAGIKVWVHTGAKVGHLLEQPHTITEADFLAVRESVWKDADTSALVPQGTTTEMGIVSPMGAKPKWRPASARRWHVWERLRRGVTEGALQDGTHRDPEGAVCGSDSDSAVGKEG